MNNLISLHYNVQLGPTGTYSTENFLSHMSWACTSTYTARINNTALCGGNFTVTFVLYMYGG